MVVVTTKDVAERAEVSSPTVSRVVNDTVYVNTKPRIKVLAAIQALHCVPNKSSPAYASIPTLALLVPDGAASFWTTVLRGAEDEAMTRGCPVFLGNTDNDPAKEIRYSEGRARRRNDGLLIAPAPQSIPLLRHLEHEGMPPVIVHRPFPGVDLDAVRSDPYISAVILTQHLLAAGHRRVAFIGGEGEQRRLRAYQDTLTMAGHVLEPALVRIGPLSERVGQQLVDALLGLVPYPMPCSSATIGWRRARSMPWGRSTPDDPCRSRSRRFTMARPSARMRRR